MAEPLPPPIAAKMSREAAREARLAAALRQNLRRRKTQARGREAQRDDPAPAEPARGAADGESVAAPGRLG